MNSNNGWSQIERILDIPVTIDSRQLKFPLLGGINNPQFSEVDLNNDGQQDLYFFDKIGNVSVTFVGDGNGNYTYTPEYATQFPKMSRIVLLRDYNGDGVQDIFTLDAESGGAGLQVHQGAYSNDTLTFQRLDLCCGFFNVIYYEANSGLINLLVPSTDYPAIEDLDRDGDLDILTFSQSGFTVDYFRNLSVERGFGLDSLHFVKEQDCWGGFAEIGLTTKIDLSDTSGDCANNLVGQEEKISQEKNPKHAGSTISVFDADADGDVEVYLGDISFDNISELTNAGDSAMAWMTAQDNQFPSYNAPVALTVFPASYFVDLDNDGLKDFIAASHSIGGTENYNSVWYYRNVGDADNLLLEFQTKSAFVEETIDLGSGSHPCFVDENADGLMDILVGNFSFFVEAGGRDSRLFLIRNTGSLTEPAFSLVDTNYLDFKQFNPTHYNFTPTFGDIDGDQDLDLIVGSESGSLFFAENEAGVGNPLVFGSIQTSYQSIDVGVGSSPVLADMDNDGLADLIVGERSGNLNYFHNGGSTGSPSFGSSPDDGFFGEVDVRDSNGFGGHSTPTLVQTNLDTFLVVG
ncbi:MAG: VCBS repeat-containing protein, partial [Bacteroidia bacterium]|nr:VCBS repeat-containing protein [Bacteroidia bacterium]